MNQSIFRANRRTSKQLKYSLKAFTLIELLIVIAIIAILAAILFPVFGRARENARRSSCQSNLKQVGLGLMQYTQDYDEYFPRTYFGVGGRGVNDAANSMRTWNDVIFPYVKSEEIFVCPSAPDSGNGNTLREYKNPDLAGYSFSTMQYRGGSYAVNAAFRNPSSPKHSPVQDPTNLKPELKISALTTPTTTIFAGDGGRWEAASTPPRWSSFRYLAYVWYDYNNGVPTIDNTLSVPTARVNNNFSDIPARHMETINILWCDGHVKAMKLQSLLERAPDGTHRYFSTEED
jgi:prepilin-type N-terminal cleavage/methylation domain-containing protein/prepilin-type processing-associated H-X9-DG protein